MYFLCKFKVLADESEDHTAPLEEKVTTVFSRGNITRVKLNEKQDRFVTVSKDGCVMVWQSPSLRLVHSTRMFDGEDRITDIVWMTRSSKIAVSCVDRSIVFLDSSTLAPMGKLSSKENSNSVPMCLGYWNDAKSNREMLIVGDIDGNCRLHMLEPSWHVCDGTLRCHPGEEVCSGATKTELRRLHSSWISKVEYIPELYCLITSSFDTTIKATNLERPEEPKFCFYHNRGVYSFAWSPHHKLIATCGRERSITLWNSHSQNHPVAVLEGHSGSVLDVAMIDSTNQLISLSADNTVRIWDTRNHKCVQVFNPTDIHGYATAIAFHPREEMLITANTVLKRWKLSKPFTPQGTSHAHTITNVLYNATFHQAVSLDLESNVCVWNVDTGELMSRFRATQEGEPHEQITSACFDDGYRRLITGSHTGKQVRMWNFSNGSMLRDFLTTTSLPSDEVEHEPLFMQATPDENQPGFSLRERRKRRRAYLQECRTASSASQTHEGIKESRHATSKTKVDQTTKPDHSTNASMNECRPRTSEHVAKEESNGITDEHLEITAVCYLVNTLPPVPGQTPVVNKYICATGWERKVYLWTDAGKDARGDADVAHRIMPPPGRDCTGHTDDILCMTYDPPTILATGGYDGRIVLWNINSGEVYGNFHVSNQPIEVIVSLPRVELLVAAGGDGMLRFLSSKERIVHSEIPAMHARGESITAMQTDHHNDYLFTADSGGYVKVWNVLNPNSSPTRFIGQCSFWQAHTCSIAALDYVETPRTLNMFLLTGSAEGTLAMWTLSGVQVGIFGQTIPWSLEDPSTYRESIPAPTPSIPLEQPKRPLGHHRSGSRSLPRYMTRNNTIDLKLDSIEHPKSGDLRNRRRRSAKSVFAKSNNLNQENSDSVVPSSPAISQPPSLVNKSATHSPLQSTHPHSHVNDELEVLSGAQIRTGHNPQPAEVWIRHEVGGAAEPQQILTIVRVDASGNVVEGWNGEIIRSASTNKKASFTKAMETESAERKNVQSRLCGEFEDSLPQEPSRIRVSLSEFVNVREKKAWSMDARLSKYIGRIFTDHLNGRPYKAVFVRLEEGQWRIIDTKMVSHPIPYMESDELPHRDISLFLLQPNIRRGTLSHIRQMSTHSSKSLSTYDRTEDQNDEDDWGVIAGSSSTASRERSPRRHMGKLNTEEEANTDSDDRDAPIVPVVRSRVAFQDLDQHPVGSVSVSGDPEREVLGLDTEDKSHKIAQSKMEFVGFKTDPDTKKNYKSIVEKPMWKQVIKSRPNDSCGKYVFFLFLVVCWRLHNRYRFFCVVNLDF